MFLLGPARMRSKQTTPRTENGRDAEGDGNVVIGGVLEAVDLDGVHRIAVLVVDLDVSILRPEQDQFVVG